MRSRCQHPAVFLVTLTSVLVGGSSLRAELILDDFDDAVVTTSPAMLGASVFTANVGALGATRSFRVASTASRAMPSIARLDADIAAPSAMTAYLATLGLEFTGGFPLFAFQFNYEFPAHDVSEGGLNDAILFDFRSISGTTGPSFFRVLVSDTTHPAARFEASLANLPLSSGAFTAAMPVESFTVRGGGPGLPDLRTIRKLEFDFYFLFAQPGSWTAEVDRIRFGAVPEPSSFLCAVSGVLGFALWRRSPRCRRASDVPENKRLRDRPRAQFQRWA